MYTGQCDLIWGEHDPRASEGSAIISSLCYFFLFQRAQPEIVTFLGYESDNALYSIPGKHILKPVSL